MKSMQILKLHSKILINSDDNIIESDIDFKIKYENL